MSTAVDPRISAREAARRRDWTTAYELLGAVEEPGADDLELLAEVAQWSGHVSERVGLLERAGAAYLREEDRRGAARVNLKLCRCHFERGDLAPAAGCLHQAASLLQGVPECAEHGFLMWTLARGAMNQGDMETLLARVTEAREIARRVGSADVEALATLDLGHALLAAGRFEEGMALMDEANAAANSGSLELQTTGTIYCSTIWSCRNLGDWPRASAWTDASLRWCDREGVTGFPGQCRFHRAEVLRMRGAYDEAEADARVAAAEMAVDRVIYAGWGWMEVGEVNRRRGDFPAAEAAFAQALGLGTDPQPGWALLSLAAGDVSRARAMIERCLDASDIIAREERVLTLPAAVSISLAAGDRETAAAHGAELVELASRLGTHHSRAAAAGAEGELALADGRPADARRLLQSAWHEWCECEAPYEAAGARLLLGRAHRLLGDEAMARIEIEAALATFEHLGARRMAEEARATLRAADPQAEAAPERIRTTFVFVDMVGSTPLVELLGDDAWGDLLGWYERTLGRLFSEHGGTVVKQEGDGFFVTFELARDAVACAVAVQRGLADHRHDHGFAPRVRIGIHTCDAHRRGDDYAGIGVHTAARIAGVAAADQILASADALEGLEGSFATSTSAPVALKGLSHPVPTAAIVWR